MMSLPSITRGLYYGRLGEHDLKGHEPIPSRSLDRPREVAELQPMA